VAGTSVTAAPAWVAVPAPYCNRLMGEEPRLTSPPRPQAPSLGGGTAAGAGPAAGVFLTTPPSVCMPGWGAPGAAAEAEGGSGLNSAAKAASAASVGVSEASSRGAAGFRSSMNSQKQAAPMSACKIGSTLTSPDTIVVRSFVAIAESGRAHDRLHPAIVEMRNMPGSGNLLGHRACSIQKVAVDSCAAVSLWARAARSTQDWCIERAGPSEQWRRTWSVAFMKHRLPGLVSPRGSKRRPPAPAATRSASAASALRFGQAMELRNRQIGLKLSSVICSQHVWSR